MYFTTIRTRALCEQERRRNQSSTFTEPLRIPLSKFKESTSQSPSSEAESELASFLEEFDQVGAVTLEQKAKNDKEMEQHPILKVHFEILVPNIVTYEDFWQRYYYRCHDLNRIVSDLTQQDERNEHTKEPEEEMKDSTSTADSFPQQEKVKSSDSMKESFENVQDRILHMASSPTIPSKHIEKEEEEDPNLTTTFDSSLTFGSTSFNVIPVETRSHTQTIAEPTSETPRAYPLFPMEKEEGNYQRNYVGDEAVIDDDSDSLGSLSLPQVPDFLSECTSVVTNPDQVHRYPESPYLNEHSETGETSQPETPVSESRDDVSETETASALDDRLAGASVFLLNDEVLGPENDLVVKITAMGGKVTDQLKGATHALWVPLIAESEAAKGVRRQNSWNEFKDTVIVTLADKHDVPIVDSDRWLRQITRLEFEEHWSDVNSEDFHPERTQAAISRSPKRYKIFKPDEEEETIKTDRVACHKKVRSISKSSQRKRSNVFALVSMLVLILALSVSQSGIFFRCNKLPNKPSKGRRWPVSRGGPKTLAKKSQPSRGGKNRKKKIPVPWWKKLLQRLKGQPQQRELGRRSK